eukprot:2184839-Pyramimonas_sp.AAC.2
MRRPTMPYPSFLVCSRPPIAGQAMIRSAQNGQPDELKVASAFVSAYNSNNMKVLRSLKGQSESDNERLKMDVDDDGKLTDPSKWGLDVPVPEAGVPDDGQPKPKRRRGKACLEDEEKFWNEVRESDWSVPTDGKVARIASRWSRAIKGTDEKSVGLKAKYDAIVAVNGSLDDAKKAFRSNWAKEEYAAFVKEKSVITTKKQTEFTNAVYLPLGRIAHKEGGGRLGWIQADCIFLLDHFLPS